MKFGVRLSIILSPFFLVALIVIHFELNRFTILNPEGIHQTKIFSEGTNTKHWQDVQQVKLGCNHTSDSDDLIYEIKWPDGSSIKFPTNIHVNGETWLTNLEAVDKEISTKSGAEFVRWTWLVQTPLHPSCLRKFYRQQGEGSKERIDRLLRIGELE